MGLRQGDQSKSYLEIANRISQNSFKAIGFEQITVDNTVQGFTLPDDARYAVCILESNATGIAARYLEFGGSGTVVTANTVGLPIKDGAVFDVTDRQNLVGFQITEESSNTTILNVQYYK